MLTTVTVLGVLGGVLAIACITAAIVDVFDRTESPYLHIAAKPADCDLIMHEFRVYDIRRVDNVLRIPVDAEDLVCQFIIDRNIEVKIL